MLTYPDDRVLVAAMNNPQDWQRVQAESWYRLSVKRVPEGIPHLDWLAFYQTSAFSSDKWAIHYYAHIEGHELLTRRDLIPNEPIINCFLHLASQLTYFFCDEGDKTRHELLKIPQLVINLSQLLC